MQTVLISALTAAVVTLLIEYAAKPYLEVRKDRILEAHRARRELIARIDQVFADVPPIQGALPHPLSRKAGVDAVEDFLTSVADIKAGYPKAAQSLGFLRRKATKTQESDLSTQYVVTRHLFDIYKDAALNTTTPVEPVNDQLATSIKEIVADLLGLRAGLAAKPSNPWSSYRTLRRLAREPMSNSVEHASGKYAATPAMD